MLIKPQSTNFAKIRVIGIGGGGSNAINSMISSSSIQGVDFVSINTDAQALLLNPAQTKIQIGEHLTKGLGSGGDPEIGMQAAEESEQKIMQMIKKQKAEIKIENGKILKERVLELIKKRDAVKEPEPDEKHYAIAARKLGKLESDDIESIKKDSMLLKDIGKLIDGDADDTRKTSR